MLGRTEEFRLPDGKVIQVGRPGSLKGSRKGEVDADWSSVNSSVVNDIGHQRSCSTPS